MGMRRPMRGAGVTFGSWLTGFLFGAAIGGTLGMLFAPRRGREMRAALQEYMPGQGVSPEFRSRVNRIIAAGRASPSDLVRQAQRELDDLRSQAVSRVEDARLRSQILRAEGVLR